MIPLHIPYGHYFRILHTCTDQAMTNALADMDLTGSQAQILGFLAFREKPPCPRDIEQTFRLTHPTVSGLLSRLEKKGFIDQRPDENDRRCKRIYILDKGRQVLSAMHQIILSTDEKLVRDFTEEEKELLAALLDRAIRNIGADICKRKPKEDTNHND